VDEPQGMVAVNAICAPTDEDAARLRAIAEASYKRLARGHIGPTPSAEAAIEELGGAPEPTPTPLPDETWPRALSGSSETMRDILEQLADRVGVDEVMIQQIVADHDDALRSHELLAEAFELS